MDPGVGEAYLIGATFITFGLSFGTLIILFAYMGWYSLSIKALSAMWNP